MDGAPTATFSVSKNSVSREANIIKITECEGVYTPEHLEMSWPVDGMLQLRKSGPGYNGQYLVDMNLKNMSVQLIENNPGQINPKDLYKGITVTLSGKEYTPVVAVTPGSYVLTVSSSVPGAPTATFSLSKSKSGMEPSVVKITSSLGADSNENLEMIWPPDGEICLRKTGENYNGLYVIDTSLRNMTIITTTPPQITGGATKVGQVMQYDFALYGQEETAVAYVDPGVYFAFITYMEPGVYNATFSLSKKRTDGEREYTVPLVTSGPFATDDYVLVPDRERTEDLPIELKVRWGHDNIVYVSKTVEEHDGVYMMKLM